MLGSQIKANFIAKKWNVQVELEPVEMAFISQNALDHVAGANMPRAQRFKAVGVFSLRLFDQRE
jgi:hypothetical protein